MSAPAAPAAVAPASTPWVVMLLVPARAPLPECWLHIPAILSIHATNDKAVCIELDRRIVELQYASMEDAKRAARCFVDAMKTEPTSEQIAAYPKPIKGRNLLNNH